GSAIEELRELCAADEPTLPGAKLLDPREHLRPPLLRDVEAELLGLDPDRVESAFLSENDLALGAHELRRVRLDRRRVVELAGDRPALAAAEGFTGYRLPRLERIPGERAHALGNRAQLLEPQIRLDAIQRAEREGNLAKVRVARTFAHPVDRPVHPARPRAHRSHCGSRRETEVVVA